MARDLEVGTYEWRLDAYMRVGTARMRMDQACQELQLDKPYLLSQEEFMIVWDLVFSKKGAK